MAENDETVIYQEGDIVQITNDSHHWYPCLVVVTEVKTWGIQGYAAIPVNDGSGTKQAYIRLANDQIEPVGRALVVAR